MRLTTLLTVMLAVVLSPPMSAQPIRPGGPTDGGTRAVADLPKTQHLRNTGGSDGSGLCVFTSIEHTSRWQSSVMAGFQQWMTRHPGGGWPDKAEEMIVRFCRENKRDIPRYIQHTGGDETILDLAMKTGRMPAITYAGQDDFYRGETIAHMVNLVHLDQEKAAIVDNNRPGQFVWMTRKQLLDRWRGVDANGRPLTVRSGMRLMPVGGGWCIVFLDSPPPPYAIRPGDDLAAAADRVQYGQCPGGVCPTPAAGEYVWLNGIGWVKLSAPAPAVTTPAEPAKEQPKPVPPEPVKADPPVEAPESKNFGVDVSKLQPGKWFANGAETTKEVALAAVAGEALADDSEKWFLVHVGTAAEQAAMFTAAKTLPAELRDRLHIRSYAPTEWQVTQFALPLGLSVRKAARGRVGEEAGRLSGEVTADTLKRFVSDCFSPPKPMPMPPVPTPAPEPQPQPAPEPAPPTPFGLPMWLLAAIAAAVTYLLTRRKP